MKSEDIQSAYQFAILFASLKHKDHQMAGRPLPYLVHLSNVAMEILLAAWNTPNFDTAFAVQLALLHDTLEDTDTTFGELEQSFSAEIAEGVLALTKNPELPADKRMTDSLRRIKILPKEVWAVKLADRITNLQEPPAHWDVPKINTYYQESLEISDALGNANAYLHHRLHLKIKEYTKFL